MRSAVERPIQTGAFDGLIVKLPHRWCRHESVERRGRQLAIMIVGAPQADQHVALRFVVTDALNEAAAWRVRAGKGLQVDRPAIFHVDRLRLSPCDMG